MSMALKKYLDQSNDELAPAVTKLLLSQAVHASSPCREALFSVIQSGLAGQSVHTALIRLEQEILSLCYIEMDKTLQKIPFQLMWPMLFMQFPAYLILLLGPLLDHLTRSL